MDAKAPFEWTKSDEVWSWLKAQIQELPNEARDNLQNNLQNNGISGESLIFFNNEYLKEMNITNTLHQDIILNAIYKLYDDKILSQYIATFPIFKSKNYDEIFFDFHIDLKTLKNNGDKISFYENIGIDDHNDIQKFLQIFEMAFDHKLIQPLPLNGIFPLQQTLSIKEKINTDLPCFIPHYQIIYWNVLNLFYNKTKYISSNDELYLNKLKSSNNNYDKAIAAEIALYYNKIDFAKQCVENIQQNALAKRMKLILKLLNIEEYKDDHDRYLNDENTFVLFEYNLQKYDGSTSDIDNIAKKLNDGINNMKILINSNNLSQCHWRFHLIYASFLCRVTLNNELVEQQIHLAQQKLRSNTDSNYLYLALCGDIYIKIKEFDKALNYLNAACKIMQNDGFCRSRILFIYLYQNKHDEAKKLWNKISVDLQFSDGIDNDILNSISLYINLHKNIDDEKNNQQIISYDGDSYIGTALKLFVGTYKSGKFTGDRRHKIMQTNTYKKSSDWAYNRHIFDNATYYDRVIVAFLILCVDMYINDDVEYWSIQGPMLDNFFSTFKRPLFSDMLDALCLENYLLGMFKLGWKGECKKAFRASIICNCHCFMNSYIGEIIGYQICGMSDIAIKKIKEIQKFISMPQLQNALELFYIDTKRMNNERDSAENELIQMIEKDDNNYDAILSLADLYLFQGKYEPALLLMQQIIEKERKLCDKNIEIKMKWGTILYFNGYLVSANKIFKEYILKNMKSSQHEYYCGIAANIFYELGDKKILKQMEEKHLLESCNLWMNRYLCYKYWSIGKKYEKAYNAANKIIKYSSYHPLGYALLSRSASLMNLNEVIVVDTYGRRLRKYEKIISYWFSIAFENSFIHYSDLVNIIVDIAKFIETEPEKSNTRYRNRSWLREQEEKKANGTKFKINFVKENVAKCVKLADKLLGENNILPQLYFESMIHCGIAMYIIGVDGSKYYNKAITNTPHGETLLTMFQKDRINNSYVISHKNDDCENKINTMKNILIKIENKLLNSVIYRKLCLFEYNFENVVNLANSWKLSEKQTPLKLSSFYVKTETQIPTISDVECKLITNNRAKIVWNAKLSSNNDEETQNNVFFKVECMNDNMEQKEKEMIDSHLMLFNKNKEKYEYEMNELKFNTKYKMKINLFVETQKIKYDDPIYTIEFKTKTKDGLLIPDEKNMFEKWEFIKNQRKSMYNKYKENVSRNTNKNDELKKYLVNNSKCDIIFCLFDNNKNQKLYPSHKLFFCAQSIIFDNMLNNTNNKNNIIPILDTSCLTFEYVQNFVYGININKNNELNVDNVINIWLFAEIYLMRSLSATCLKFVEQILSQTENLKKCLKLLETIKSESSQIYNECLLMFLNNNGLYQPNKCKSLFESIEFLYISKKLLKNLISSSWINCSEWIIFKSVMRWILMKMKLNDINNRLMHQIESNVMKTLRPWTFIDRHDKYWIEFKPLIRFNRMKPEEFVNNLSESNILNEKERWEILKYFALNRKDDTKIKQMFNTKQRGQRSTQLITINDDYKEDDDDDMKYEYNNRIGKCGAGGILTVPILRKAKFKCLDKFFRGYTIGDKYLEKNKNDIKKAKKFKLLTEKQIFRKLSKYIDQEQSLLISAISTVKINKTIGLFEEILSCIESDNNINWSDIYDAVITLCQLVMDGFAIDGIKSRNPILVKLSFKYIDLAMLNATINYKKDNGLFTVYLNWLLKTLKEKKFYELSTKCLLNTMYQYSPKIVFTMIEQLLFDSFNIEQLWFDSFKNESDWYPIISFLAIAIREFGINNFYPLRILRIIHTYLLKAKGKNGKSACYDLIIQIYIQVGTKWSSVIKDNLNLSREKIKHLVKEFKKITFANGNGTYNQLRCWAKEVI